MLLGGLIWCTFSRWSAIVGDGDLLARLLRKYLGQRAPKRATATSHLDILCREEHEERASDVAFIDIHWPDHRVVARAGVVGEASPLRGESQPGKAARE